MLQTLETQLNPMQQSEGLSEFQQLLERDLEGNCNFSEASRALYTSDASNYRQIPLGVVYPKSREDIVLAHRLCAQFSLPLLTRGGGTSQNGQCVNEAIILDCSRYLNRVISIDTEKRTALIDPGVVCDSLKAAAEAHGLTFGPDPATHSRCTLGGMIGNNSCGPHSMLAGKTVENVEALEILTSDGARFWVSDTSAEQFQEICSRPGRQADIYKSLAELANRYANQINEKYPNIKRRVSGYNLDQLLPENNFNVARALVGSEGTCVTVLRAKVTLIENPVFKQLLVLGFTNIFEAGDAVPTIMPFTPIAMEGLDWEIIGGLNERNLRQAEIALLPEGKAWLLVELAESNLPALETKVASFEKNMAKSALVRSCRSVSDPKEIQAMWSIREQGASATALSLDPNQPDSIVGWEDTAVDPMQLGDYLRELKALVKQYGYKTSLYGHFGDGCIHARMTFDTRTENGVLQWRRFSEDIAHLVVKYGGSLSGEHGDGQAKAEFLPIMYGEELMQAFREFKRIWDPESRMNPGKLIDAYKMDDNLRYGPSYQTPVLLSQLNFESHPAGLGRASEHCIGMGKCRSHNGAMCPSYQATGEERYSTRGRAHLIHETLRNDVLKDGWQNEFIADSFEHCLSCKACKTECPTAVDVAGYKAEFMHRHYSSRRRPLNHWVFGFIGKWLPMLSKLSPLVNFTQSSFLVKPLKQLLTLRDEAQLPKLARHSFQQQLNNNKPEKDEHFYWFGNVNDDPVVLWPDSVNNHYRPHIVQSAINVLCLAGYKVAIPREAFCCGRSLFEYGFLDQAKNLHQQILHSFAPTLPDGADIIVLEPSCLSSFHDELLKFFPNDENAIALSNRCKSIGHFLNDINIELKRTVPNGILHLHCHEKNTPAAAHERELLKQCFENITEPELGCCGMAGTFGIKKQTAHIGDTLFKRKLEPAVNASTKDALLVASGFSCASQFAAQSDQEPQLSKPVLHPIEVLELCMSESDNGTA